MPIHKIYVAPPIPVRKKSSASASSTDSTGYSSDDRQGVMSFAKRKLAFLATSQQNVRPQVQAEFITRTHMSAIEKASREGNFAGSFRAAGGPTLAALDRGAAAKGHNILEKTIKQGSLKNVYGEAHAPALLKLAQTYGLAGMVGAWGGANKSINGVYVHNKASQATGDLKDEVFPLSLDDPESIQRYHEAVKGGNIIPYTGDYDMHDLIQFSDNSPKGRVPEADGHEETAMKDRINREVAAVDPARPFESEPTNVIRHGPRSILFPICGAMKKRTSSKMTVIWA